MIYAYARVSSRDQNLTRQLDAFEAFGVDKSTSTATKRAAKTFRAKATKSCLKNLKRVTFW